MSVLDLCSQLWLLLGRCLTGAYAAMEQRWWGGKPYISRATFFLPQFRLRFLVITFLFFWGEFLKQEVVSFPKCRDVTPENCILYREFLWILPFQGGFFKLSSSSPTSCGHFSIPVSFQEEKPEYPLTVHGARRDSGFAKVGWGGDGGVVRLSNYLICFKLFSDKGGKLHK